MAKIFGEGTILFNNKPRILSYGSVVGKKEHEGPMSHEFDEFTTDSFFGEDSFEKAESKLQKTAVQIALDKAGLENKDIDKLFAGDLLNQCIGSSFGNKEREIPFIGLYGACSTMALSTALASLFVDCGASKRAVAVTSSHFCSAERQYRFPLNYGSQRPQTSQWTVTGSGALVISKEGKGPVIESALFGKIVDLNVTDTNNMGAAMAPDDVKIRPYPTHEGMVFFYTKIQCLRGLENFLRIFYRKKLSKKLLMKLGFHLQFINTKRRNYMNLYESLLSEFGYNKPILFSEIKFNNWCPQQISRDLRKLCQDGKVVKFDSGIYYIPKTTQFGVAHFNPKKVIDKKFIKDGENVFGYYSGGYLQYELGISKLKPAVIEIYTNKECQDLHKVKLGSYQISLRKPRMKIDKFNASVLCFLELMNGIDVETLDEYKRKLITDYIAENRITQRQITKYIPYFPDKTCRNLIESEVIYRVPQ